MVNSSWTQNHVNAILQHSDVLLDTVRHMIPLRMLLSSRFGSATSARVVYPSCDTREMSQYPLTGRDRVILSLAQFRYISQKIMFGWLIDVSLADLKKITQLNYELSIGF